MKSKLANEKRKELIEACKCMTPIERILAFIEHSKNVATFFSAGKKKRLKSGDKL